MGGARGHHEPGLLLATHARRGPGRNPAVSTAHSERGASPRRPAGGTRCPAPRRGPARCGGSWRGPTQPAQAATPTPPPCTQTYNHAGIEYTFGGGGVCSFWPPVLLQVHVATALAHSASVPGLLTHPDDRDAHTQIRYLYLYVQLCININNVWHRPLLQADAVSPRAPFWLLPIIKKWDCVLVNTIKSNN